MFGIGLPELIVIMAVALIVVGPDKLPDLARSMAKGLMELKKTMNQVKESLTEEENVLNDVQSDLKKAAGDLQERLLDTETKTWQHLESPHPDDTAQEDVIDLTPVDERPWEADRKKEPDTIAADVENSSTNGETDPGTREKKADLPDSKG